MEYDVVLCVYGGTAAGLTAAMAAAKRGKSVLVVEPSRWLGGMVGGGIRLMTDCEYPRDVGGITRDMLLTELTFKVFDPNKGQRELRELWQSLVDRHNVEVIFEHRLAAVAKSGTQIESITLDHAPPLQDGVPAPAVTKADAHTINARVFIDASYEGDLLAKADVPYIVGRESRDTYNESLAGVRHVKLFKGVSPWRQADDPSSGLMPFIPSEPLGNEGDASRFFIPFNFRFVGSMLREKSGTQAPAPTDPPEGDAELMQRIRDAGHLLVLSSNYDRHSLLNGTIPGFTADYPEADWATRSNIWRTLIEHVRLLSQVSGEKLGLLRDMYPDTDGWPHQLYVRMARRMRGRYVMTQADLAHQTDIPDSIGLGYYNVDIYPCRMVVLDDGTLATEGETWELVSPGPYPISYRAITPEREHCTNLLVPVCISASHVACASIRMEPTFMIMGESAGIAASLAHDAGVAVQDVEMATLRAALLEAGQILAWDGEGYGARFFNKPFDAWWLKHPEEYRHRPVRD